MSHEILPAAEARAAFLKNHPKIVEREVQKVMDAINVAILKGENKATLFGPIDLTTVGLFETKGYSVSNKHTLTGEIYTFSF